MSEANATPDIATFSELLRAALGDLLDPSAERFLDMLADDAVMEFPYAPPGYVTALHGRREVEAHLAGFGDILQIDSMRLSAVHRSTDAQTVVVEFSCRGRGTKTGAPYDQRYVSVIALRDGKITRYSDYWNPLVVLSALRDRDTITKLVAEA